MSSHGNFAEKRGVQQLENISHGYSRITTIVVLAMHCFKRIWMTNNSIFTLWKGTQAGLKIWGLQKEKKLVHGKGETRTRCIMSNKSSCQWIGIVLRVIQDGRTLSVSLF